MARIGGKTEYTREDVIELLAAIRAAGDLFLADDVKLPTETRCDAVSELATELEERLLGEVVGTEGDGDEPWATDADELALRIREAELEAQLIESGYAGKVRDAEVKARLETRQGRPAKLRVFADRLRAAGTQADVHFPSASDMSEIVGVGRDAR